MYYVEVIKFMVVEQAGQILHHRNGLYDTEVGGIRQVFFHKNGVNNPQTWITHLGDSGGSV